MNEIDDQKPKRKDGAPYRPLTIPERDMLFAFYEKYNGNMSEMVLDKDCLFKSYTQIRYYAKYHHFYERLVEIRRKKAQAVNAALQDAKIKAVENAIRMLEPRHRFVFTKTGVQIFDAEGKPLIVEQLPYYKELKTAWEIIKTELGEPTSISKGDLTSGGKPIQGNGITFVNFKGDAPAGK